MNNTYFRFDISYSVNINASGVNYEAIGVNDTSCQLIPDEALIECLKIVSDVNKNIQKYQNKYGLDSDNGFLEDLPVIRYKNYTYFITIEIREGEVYCFKISRNQ